MSKETKSAELLLKLYELRREEKMREARDWFISFFPVSVDDIMSAMIDPITSPKYRMVITYWEMAASFVNHGAIDHEMFLDASGEPIVHFAKVAPFLGELRERMQSPGYLKHLEELTSRIPDTANVLEAHRQRMKRWMAARAELAAKAAS